MKRIASMLFAITLLLTISATAFAADVSVISPWAEEYVKAADSEYDILPDSLKNTDYTEDITRESFCELAYSSMKYIASNLQYGMNIPSNTMPFTDTSNVSVSALYNAGIIEGETDTSFAPESFLTREQAATILARIAFLISRLIKTT